MIQPDLFNIVPAQKDIVYTQKRVVMDILNWLKPTGTILDPCLGDGAFYECMPNPKDWCEILKGRNFFEYTKKVDWIIGNPPYSIFEEWLEHSFNIANSVVYVLPTNKIFQRKIIMKMINDYGGIRGLRVYGSGQNIGFPFGFSTGTFWFERDYKGECNLVLSPELRSNFCYAPPPLPTVSEASCG